MHPRCWLQMIFFFNSPVINFPLYFCSIRVSNGSGASQTHVTFDINQDPRYNWISLLHKVLRLHWQEPRVGESRSISRKQWRRITSRNLSEDTPAIPKISIHNFYCPKIQSLLQTTIRKCCKRQIRRNTQINKKKKTHNSSEKSSRR